MNLMEQAIHKQLAESKLDFSKLGTYEGGKRQAKADFGAKAVNKMKVPAVSTSHNLGDLIDVGEFDTQRQLDRYYDEVVVKQKGKIELVK